MALHALRCFCSPRTRDTIYMVSRLSRSDSATLQPNPRSTIYMVLRPQKRPFHLPLR